MPSIKYNATNKPIKYKTWTVGVDVVTENQLKFLTGYGISAKAILDDRWFTTSSGARYNYGAGGRAEFETTTEEQESMLKLMYGKDLILVLDEIVLPNMYTEYK